MRRAVPLFVVLVGFAVYVYFARIRPAREYDPTVRGSGSIEATEVLVSAKIAARINTVNVDEGDQVGAGQILVTLVCDDMQARKAQAEAQVVQAEAARSQAEAALAQAMAQTAPLTTQRDLAAREYERTQKLAKDEAVAERNVDQALSALRGGEEQVRAAQLAVDVARRAVAVARSQVELAVRSVALADTQLSECSIAAPRAGVVLARVREPGELALPGASIIRIGRLDEVYTWIYVPNEEVGRVRLGQKVKLTADTYAGRAFVGTVARINEQAEFTPRSIQTKEDRTRLVYGVKVVVANPDHALMPGMPVEAELDDAAGPAVSGRK
jgi:HlyD family secretion protein